MINHCETTNQYLCEPFPVPIQIYLKATYTGPGAWYKRFTLTAPSLPLSVYASLSIYLPPSLSLSFSLSLTCSRLL